MVKKLEDQENFLEALWGILFEPGEAVPSLLQEDSPRFGLLIPLMFFLAIFVPILSQSYKYGNFIYEHNAVLSLFIVFCLTYITFFILEGIFLSLFGFYFSIRHLVALFAYCLAPFLLALLLVYTFNYLSMGRLSLIAYLMTGLSQADDKFMRVVPIALLIAQVNAMLVFYYGLSFITKAGSTVAFLASLLSLAPFYAALLVSLFVAEHVRPGMMQIFWRMLGLVI